MSKALETSFGRHDICSDQPSFYNLQMKGDKAPVYSINTFCCGNLCVKNTGQKCFLLMYEKPCTASANTEFVYRVFNFKRNSKKSRYQILYKYADDGTFGL